MRNKGRTRVDEKGRISLAKFLDKDLPMYLDVEVSSDGTITLTPMVTIPARDLYLYNNQKTLESLREINQVASGNVKRRITKSD